MSQDLAETLLGIAPDSPLAALRARRGAIRRHAQGAFRELVQPDAPGGLSATERAALALRVALIEGCAPLAQHYRALLGALGTPAECAAAEAFPAGTGGDRFTLLLHYADLVAAEPERCAQEDIDELTEHGLSAQDIVAATQLIAFVPFQTRLLAGLRALQQEAAGA
jgi:CMD domain protein